MDLRRERRGAGREDKKKNCNSNEASRAISIRIPSSI